MILLLYFHEVMSTMKAENAPLDPRRYLQFFTAVLEQYDVCFAGCKPWRSSSSYSVCGCDDCQELDCSLLDRDERMKQSNVKQSRREHLQSRVTAASAQQQLCLYLETWTRGSPHVLEITKTNGKHEQHQRTKRFDEEERQTMTSVASTEELQEVLGDADGEIMLEGTR